MRCLFALYVVNECNRDASPTDFPLLLKNGKLESKLVSRNTLIPVMRGLPEERHEPEAGVETVFRIAR